ncbi:MAG: signal peptide peptidase SppA [Deltaproteobacteria bacterium]|nr:signal peptide peptidase SppA [Deltaproteobacteria bacterium]
MTNRTSRRLPTSVHANDSSELWNPGRQRPGFRSFGGLGALVLAMALATPGCVSLDILSLGPDGPPQQSVVQGEAGPKILLLEIDGVISNADAPSFFGGSSMGTVARVRNVLDLARRDPEIKGVLLRIDSPGGTATASEQVYTEILRFKKEKSVPVVAQLLTTAASGGYYIAMAADEVQAHPTTVVGSIGVIFTSLNFAGLMEKLGVEDQTITGGEFKDIGSPFRPLTEEERAQLQSIVDDLHARFREVVDRGRPNLDTVEVAALANGRIYSARQALENGLVDRVGAMGDAVGLLSDRIGAPKVRVVAYHKPNTPRSNFYMQAPAVAAPSIDPESMGPALAPLLGRPGFHYLWWPGLSGLR